ncbi:helix-turn-helix domain-containing protein [Methylobacterium sp. J-030]|uniref:helix-turn-helix domain-containing protein n=1 Tax=Methylobacterium sp. J-030 TaxID=2836627 RepID=UPI001FBA64C6|nr:helix-turn-helix domain-containing protein [Methylobacterium sp. J-030]MCJ2072487.1 helix-turn-helix domain-containing protein [Methylobacterium sp. J-030]
MPLCAAHPAERRAAVLQLLRETDLPITEIAARTGIKPRTIKSWNARDGWPRPPHWHSVFLRWSTSRRQAVARLLSQPGNDPADIAAALGFGHSRTECLSAAIRLTPLTQSTAGDPTPTIDAANLLTHLRAHIARQIAAYDAALSQEGVALAESARILRDLGGLKRLLDEIDAEGACGATGEGGDDGSERDLPALRAEIARRYDGFVGRGAPA